MKSTSEILFIVSGGRNSATCTWNNKAEVADAFNDFVTNIGQKLASQIPKSSKTFETYIKKNERHNEV